MTGSGGAYDVAVLGCGPGGYAAALRAAMRGARACCIEADKLGGTCLNVGCIPTKAMLHASGLMWNMRGASQFGISTSETRLDTEAFFARVDKIVAGLRRGMESMLGKHKVDVIRGRGRIISPGRISVQEETGTEEVEAASIIVATGSRPARPKFLPQDSGRIMTTDEAISCRELPESVVIVGGGVIGCEFATLYSELGTRTIIVEMRDRLLADLDEEASAAVCTALARRGANVLTGTTVVAVEANGERLRVSLDSGKSCDASHILTAVGREPYTAGAGLDSLDIEMDGCVIRVDDHCRTNVAGIYAVGDVAEKRHYAHLATRMGIVAAENATGHVMRDPRDVVPLAVYTHPEIAAVGLSEAEASREPTNTRVSRSAYVASGIARAYGQTEGMVKIIAEADSGRILGATIIGLRAAETIHEVALAMRNGLTVKDLAETIHNHPTFAEAVGEAATAWLGLSPHGFA